MRKVSICTERICRRRSESSAVFYVPYGKSDRFVVKYLYYAVCLGE